MKPEDVMEVESTEVVQVETRPLPATVGSIPEEQMLEVVEARRRFLERARPIAIACTRGSNWNEFGESVRPDIAACETIIRQFGISVTDTRMEKMESRDDDGSYYIWTCYARFTLPNNIDSIEGMGTCSSRDKFLGTRHNTQSERKLTQVTEDHVMKKARTNCWVNGTMNILGLHGLTKADLKTSGVQGQATTVKFNSPGGGGGGGDAQQTPRAHPDAGSAAAASDDLDPTAVKKAFFEVIDKITALGVPEAELFEKYMKFQGGEVPTRRQIAGWRKEKGIRWLERLTKEIAEKELNQ